MPRCLHCAAIDRPYGPAPMISRRTGSRNTTHLHTPMGQASTCTTIPSCTDNLQRLAVSNWKANCSRFKSKLNTVLSDALWQSLLRTNVQFPVWEVGHLAPERCIEGQ